MNIGLVVISGAHAGREFLLDKSEIGIGRAPDNAICLANPTISRSHARIFQRDGIWYLVDLQSAKGTLHNGVEIGAPAQLRPGDTIQVGDTILRFQCTDILTPSAPPPIHAGNSTEFPVVPPRVANGPQNLQPQKKLDFHFIVQISAFAVLAIVIMSVTIMSFFPSPRTSNTRTDSSSGTLQESKSNSVPSGAQIRIDNVRVIPWQSPNNSQPLQMVLVDWTNTGSKRITALTATITLYDAAGRVKERIPDYYIYTSQDYGRAVQPGQSFVEPIGDGHILFPDQYGFTERVHVEIVRIMN